MSNTTSKLLLVAAGAIAITASLQAQSLRIVSAQYGHDRRWIDVADVLNRSIRGGVLDFTPSNEYFRADPAPAEQKILRIEYVMRGQSYREDYPENTRVVLGSNGGNGRYRAAPQTSTLRIISARYGAGPRATDVTELLQRQVSNGGLAVRVDNNSMQGDPAIGAPKMLSVEYEYSGRRMRAEVREGEDLRLPGAGGAPSGYNGAGGAGLRIVSAEYGAGNRFVDVARMVNGYIDRSGSQLRMRVNNDTMGGDPVRGPDKILRIQYTFNGQPDSVEVREGDELNLPRQGVGGGPGYRAEPAYGGDRGVIVLSASYGARDRFRDVTGILQGRLNGDGIRMRVTNDTMGGDPYPGPDKVLRVDYQFQGQRLHKDIREGDDLILP